MQLENSFTVPAGIDRAWASLQDVEALAPCLPGATLESYDGQTASGKVKVKVGPVQMTYTGKAVFLERDEAAHRIVIEASGREARGTGTAAATATATLQELGATETRVTVLTDLTITGKAAQFGRGVLQDVAAKIVGQFADNLAVLMSASPADGSAAAPAATAAPADLAGTGSEPASGPAPSPAAAPQLPHQADAIDLFDTAGAPVLKRVAPVVAGLGLLALIWWLFSRRGRDRD